ncbi:NACHT domain-containing protein [Actinoplanes xinjiangensis]|uniref:NACHT domain-containing protein n=2 Tax=Actinoplanes xinjiangensis TaxID=512350 RepID=A0A316ENN3_9ACTN|nr:NACHT domain-containing protein [Actinoplanes xinjiangensis]PWK33311.1 NACHT domain-containing protein [Actinoplanes xinjiangensis]
MMRCVWRWWRRASRVGWILFGVAVVAAGLVVLGSALLADLAVARLAGPDADPADLAAAKDEFDRWTGWANIIALPVGGAGIAIIAVEKFLRSRSTVTDDGPLIRALTADVENTIRRELDYRQAGDPAPIVVRWSATGRPAAGWDAVLGDGTAGSGLPLFLDGDAVDIVTRFRELPRRQLVILGAPGAGKSVLAMLLALGLLENPEEGQRVPVVIALNGWRADTEPLSRILERGLVDGHQTILADAGDPERVARWLLEHRRILPVLDGLDELPAAGRAEAIRQLKQYCALGNHLVLTSRGPEYEDAVRSGDTILTSAAVVEIEPVAAKTATAYLSYPESRRPLWEPVFAVMRAGPDAPVSRTLTSSLMIALARSAYQRDPHRPGELLDFAKKELVARRLMDVFVTAAYQRSKGARGTANARRWLSTLAYHLYEEGTRDLHWWQIQPDLLTRHRRLARVVNVGAGLLTVTVAAALCGAVTDGGSGAITAGSVALPLGLGVATQVLGVYPMRPRPFGVRLGPLPILGSYLATSVACGLAVGVLTGNSEVAVVVGATFGSVSMGSVLRRSVRRREPRDPRFDNHQLSSSTIAVLSLLEAMVGFGSAALVGGLTDAMVAAAVLGTVTLLATGGWRRLLFRLTHLRLVLAGRLPLQLARFLDDAHRKRAVLRRAGAVYQFRHALLQDHLALVQAADHTRALMNHGDKAAATRLTAMLTTLGRSDEVTDLLHHRWESGDRYVARQLALRRIESGRREEGLRILRAASTDDRKSAKRDRAVLARLLARFGMLDELRSRADAGDDASAERLMECLIAAGELDEAVRRAIDRSECDSGLIRSLVDNGRLRDVRTLAESGEYYSIEGYLEHLVKDARIAEAEAWVGTLPRYQEHGRRRLHALLFEHGNGRAALRSAREAHAQQVEGAASRLALVLCREGDIESAVEVLRGEPPEDTIATQLADILLDADRTAEAFDVLRDRPAAASQSVARRLVDHLVAASRGDEAVAYMRARSAVLRRFAFGELVGLLLRLGRLDEAIQTVQDGASYDAVLMVARSLFDGGRADEAIELLRTIKNERLWGEETVEMLAEAGAFDEIEARADDGDRAALYWRLDRMVATGRGDEAIALLQARMTGDRGRPVWDLANLLGQLGRIDEATAMMRRSADAGDNDAQAWLDAADTDEPFWKRNA